MEAKLSIWSPSHLSFPSYLIWNSVVTKSFLVKSSHKSFLFIASQVTISQYNINLSSHTIDLCRLKINSWGISVKWSMTVWLDDMHQWAQLQCFDASKIQRWSFCGSQSSRTFLWNKSNEFKSSHTSFHFIAKKSKKREIKIKCDLSLTQVQIIDSSQQHCWTVACRVSDP